MSIAENLKGPVVEMNKKDSIYAVEDSALFIRGADAASVLEATYSTNTKSSGTDYSTVVKCLSRLEWDSMSLEDQIESFRAGNVHIKGPPKDQVLPDITSLDCKNELDRLSAIDKVLHCHCEYSLSLFFLRLLKFDMDSLLGEDGWTLRLTAS